MVDVQVVRRGRVYLIEFNDGSKAWLSFKEEGGRLYLLETFTPEQHRGKGYGAKLVEAAIMDAEERNLKIVPICSYSIHYFLKNRGARRVLADEYRVSDEELKNYYERRIREEREGKPR